MVFLADLIELHSLLHIYAYGGLMYILYVIWHFVLWDCILVESFSIYKSHSKRPTLTK